MFHHRTYIDEDTVHYEIYIAEDLIVDEILSSEDADVNWDQYERFFGLRVSDKLVEDNQTRYIGIILDKDVGAIFILLFSCRFINHIAYFS